MAVLTAVRLVAILVDESVDSLAVLMAVEMAETTAGMMVVVTVLGWVDKKVHS